MQEGWSDRSNEGWVVTEKTGVEGWGRKAGLSRRGMGSARGKEVGLRRERAGANGMDGGIWNLGYQFWIDDLIEAAESSPKIRKQFPIPGGNTTLNYIGRSRSADPGWYLDDFRIYSGVLTRSDVQQELLRNGGITVLKDRYHKSDPSDRRVGSSGYKSTLQSFKSPGKLLRRLLMLDGSFLNADFEDDGDPG
eukprot:2311991-Rhodomonas_salina.1